MRSTIQNWKKTFHKIQNLEKGNQQRNRKKKETFQNEGFFDGSRRLEKAQNWRCERGQKIKKKRKQKNIWNQKEGTRNTKDMCWKKRKNKRKKKNTKRIKWNKEKKKSKRLKRKRGSKQCKETQKQRRYARIFKRGKKKQRRKKRRWKEVFQKEAQFFFFKKKTKRKKKKKTLSRKEVKPFSFLNKVRRGRNYFFLGGVSTRVIKRIIFQFFIFGRKNNQMEKKQQQIMKKRMDWKRGSGKKQLFRDILFLSKKKKT